MISLASSKSTVYVSFTLKFILINYIFQFPCHSKILVLLGDARLALELDAWLGFEEDKNLPNIELDACSGCIDEYLLDSSLLMGLYFVVDEVPGKNKKHFVSEFYN